jgi:hypothetical protein
LLTIPSIRGEVSALRKVHHLPLDDTLVVTDNFLLTVPVLELVLRLAPDAVFDPEALPAAVDQD